MSSYDDEDEQYRARLENLAEVSFMANCYAEAWGDRGSGHRIGRSDVSAKVSTWTGYIRVWLDKDNKGRIEMSNVDVSIGGFSANTGRKPTLEEVSPSIEDVKSYMKTKFRSEHFRFPQREWDALIAKLVRKKALSEM